MGLVWRRTRVSRLTWHGGRVSLGLSLFGARALVPLRPVRAPPLPGVVHPKRGSVLGCAWWGGLR